MTAALQTQGLFQSVDCKLDFPVFWYQHANLRGDTEQDRVHFRTQPGSTLRRRAIRSAPSFPSFSEVHCSHERDSALCRAAGGQEQTAFPASPKHGPKRTLAQQATTAGGVPASPMALGEQKLELVPILFGCGVRPHTTFDPVESTSGLVPSNARCLALFSLLFHGGGSSRLRDTPLPELRPFRVVLRDVGLAPVGLCEQAQLLERLVPLVFVKTEDEPDL